MKLPYLGYLSLLKAPFLFLSFRPDLQLLPIFVCSFPYSSNLSFYLSVSLIFTISLYNCLLLLLTLSIYSLSLLHLSLSSYVIDPTSCFPPQASCLEKDKQGILTRILEGTVHLGKLQEKVKVRAGHRHYIHNTHTQTSWHNLRSYLSVRYSACQIPIKLH